MSVWLALLLQAASPGVAPAASDVRARAQRLPVTLPGILPRCGPVDADDIVVCGDRKDRYRLPLPLDDASPSDRRVRGEAASPLATITPTGRCGLFAGQRACGKAEAARYGYGMGRDPLSVLTKLGRKIADPDGDVGEPMKIP